MSRWAVCLAVWRNASLHACYLWGWYDVSGFTLRSRSTLNVLSPPFGLFACRPLERSMDRHSAVRLRQRRQWDRRPRGMPGRAGMRWQ